MNFANGGHPDLKMSGGELLTKGITVSLERASHVGSRFSPDEVICRRLAR